MDYLPLTDLKWVPELRGANGFFTSLPDWFALDALADIEARHDSPEWLVDTRMILRIAKPFCALLSSDSRTLRSLAVCDVGKLRKDIINPTYDIGWDNRHLSGELPQLGLMRKAFRASSPFEGPEHHEFEAHKHLGVHSLRRLLQSARNMSDSVGVLFQKVPLSDCVEGMNSLSSLHDVMACVQAKTDELSCRDVDDFALRCRSEKYSTLQLVHAFCLAQELKADSHLRTACLWALRLTLPPALAEEYIEKLISTSEIRLPSAATMSRTRGRVDAAWILTFRETVRELLAKGLVSYLTWDASPQGGKELEMFVWDFVAETCLPQMQIDISWLEMRSYVIQANTHTHS